MGRILDYPEKPSPGLNDYLLVDSSSEGTKKISASNIVTVDSSLTQPGQPADAKKTGDEIASIKTDLDNIPTVDSTLTQSGQAADAKVTGDKITGLKEDLNNTFFAFPVGVTSQYVVGSTGEIKGNTNWDYAEFDLTGLDGETLSLKTTLYNNFAAGWAIFNTSGEYISGDTTPTATVILPQNVGKILISICKINLPLTYNDISVACSFGKSVVRAGSFKGYFEGFVDDTLTKSGEAADSKVVGDKIGDLKSALGQNIDSMRKAFPASTNLFNIDDPDVMNGKYITNTGQQATSQTGVLCESGWIAVEPSTQYTIGADGLDHPRYITEYDSSKNVISGSGASEANITTTANTAYIRFCFRNTNTNWRMNKGSAKLPYEPFYYDYIKTDDTLTDEYLPANAKTVGDMFANAGFSNQTYTADDV